MQSEWCFAGHPLHCRRYCQRSVPRYVRRFSPIPFCNLGMWTNVVCAAGGNNRSDNGRNDTLLQRFHSVTLEATCTWDAQSTKINEQRPFDDVTSRKYYIAMLQLGTSVKVCVLSHATLVDQSRSTCVSLSVRLAAERQLDHRREDPSAKFTHMAEASYWQSDRLHHRNQGTTNILSIVLQ